MKKISLLALICLMAGCASGPQGRYAIDNDRAPMRLPTAVEIEDIEPRDEPKSRQGNRDYVVRGISYKVMDSAEGYQRTGIASWYGSKFHGHLTANGEIYNMYSLSAAHTSLPLPTYLKVTNLANGKHTIVRVNDRGPFHPDRIIDLSYAAAYKLDMLKTGTAQVRLEAVTPEATAQVLPPLEQAGKLYYLQLAASGNSTLARAQVERLASEHHTGSRLQPAGKLFRLQLGPFHNKRQGQSLLDKLKADFPRAFLIAEDRP